MLGAINKISEQQSPREAQVAAFDQPRPTQRDLPFS